MRKLAATKDRLLPLLLCPDDCCLVSLCSKLLWDTSGGAEAAEFGVVSDAGGPVGPSGSGWENCS